MSTFLKEYDVVIVGSGIAGPVAARYLAKGGLNTLLLESGKMPRNKPCSAIQFKYFKRILGAKPPKQKLCTNPLTKLYMELPNGRSFKLPFKMYNFTRDVFDEWLASVAVGAGAEFRDGVRCQGFEKTSEGFEVLLKPKKQEIEKVKTKYLVAADGLSSKIRLILRPQDFQEKNPGVTLNYYIRSETDGDLDPNTLYQFWNLDFNNLMFAWVYKKNDLWVVGTGYTGGIKERCDMFLEYVKNKFNFDGEIVKREGFGSKFCLLDPKHTYMGEGNLLMLGDAAGLVDMYRGLGMDAAALSGRRCARAILKAEKGKKAAIDIYKKSMRKLEEQIERNAGRGLINLETNQDLMKFMRKSFIKMGMGTAFGVLFNKLKPINKFKLVPA